MRKLVLGLVTCALLPGVAFAAPHDGKGPAATDPGNSETNPQGGAPGVEENTSATDPATDTSTDGGTTTVSSLVTVARDNPFGGVPGISGGTPPQAPPPNPGGNGGVGGGNVGKITICHATGSETNPFVEITISLNAIPAHTNHQDGRDIIPAPPEGCPGGENPPPPPPPDDNGNPPDVLVERGGGSNEPQAVEAVQASGEADELPFTGMNAGVLLFIGLTMGAAGLTLQRLRSRMGAPASAMPIAGLSAVGVPPTPVRRHDAVQGNSTSVSAQLAGVALVGIASGILGRMSLAALRRR